MQSSIATPYRLPIDPQTVSLTEPFEVSRFVDDYLRSRGHQTTGRNRTVVRNTLSTYHAKAPVPRCLLTAYLDRVIPRG